MTFTPTSVTPANGASLVAETAAEIEADPPQWSMTTQPGLTSVGIRVSTSPAVGADGMTLSDLDQAGFFELYESATNPGVYTGPAANSWLSQPGTYYWQIQAGDLQSGVDPVTGFPTSTFSQLVSPIYTLTVSAPAPPPPTTPTFSRAQAAGVVPAAIRQATGRRPSNLHVSCQQAAALAFGCNVSWRDPVSVWAGKMSVTYDAANQQADYSFSGLRATLACVRRKSVKRCARHVSF